MLGGQWHGGPVLWGSLLLLEGLMLRRGSGCTAVTPGVALAPSSRGSACMQPGVPLAPSLSHVEAPHLARGLGSCAASSALWCLRAPLLGRRGLWPLQGGHMSHGARNCRQLEL